MNNPIEMGEALELLYSETADYITINQLGNIHHNQSMKLSQLALTKFQSVFKGE